MRAIRARYNPYLQAKHRLEQVVQIHAINIYNLLKIVMSGVGYISTAILNYSLKIEHVCIVCG